SVFSEDPREKRNALKGSTSPGNSSRHWVLVVLLLGNVIVNESLPIFLDNALGGGVAAIAISTTAIVIFGYIIPHAISVRYGLYVGATCVPLVLILMFPFAPIAYPIAKILDYILGADKYQTHKAELKSFLQFHRTGEEPLREEVEKMMTPLRDVVILSTDDILDHTAIASIKALPVSAFPLSILPKAHPSINCFQALNYFQSGRAHLILVTLTPGKSGGAIGVITLEEIVDETDLYQDNQTKVMARRSPNSTMMKGYSTALLGRIHSRNGSFDGRTLSSYRDSPVNISSGSETLSVRSNSPGRFR
ncbi:hypothetical protein BYT27DRAFT_7203487, partial [Phlegmacium glaucopus]